MTTGRPGPCRNCLLSTVYRLLSTVYCLPSTVYRLLPLLDPEARLLVGMEAVDGALGEGGDSAALEAEAAVVVRVVEGRDVPIAHVLECLAETFHQVGQVIDERAF